jgi:hypothetical protein
MARCRASVRVVGRLLRPPFPTLAELPSAGEHLAQDAHALEHVVEAQQHVLGDALLTLQAAAVVAEGLRGEEIARLADRQCAAEGQRGARVKRQLTDLIDQVLRKGRAFPWRCREEREIGPGFARPP